jgi:FtsH-binding integral membrane protein
MEMSAHSATVPVLDAPVEERGEFLRRVGSWTVGGLAFTALMGIVSAMYIAPAVFQGGRWAVIAVVYGSFLLAQTVARKMVYGTNKVAGFVLGTAMQGVALGFLLLITVLMTRVDQGLLLIGQCLLLTLTTALGMLCAVYMSRSSMSFLRPALAMLTLPMLLIMVLQLVFPIGGTLGLIISVVFVIVSAIGLLYRLNHVVREMDTTMAVEGAYEITLSIVVLFWNLLSLMNRRRR